MQVVNDSRKDYVLKTNIEKLRKNFKAISIFNEVFITFKLLFFNYDAFSESKYLFEKDMVTIFLLTKFICTRKRIF